MFRCLNDSISNRIIVVHKNAEASGMKHLLIDLNVHISPTNERYQVRNSNCDVLLDMFISENLEIWNDITSDPKDQTWSRKKLNII